MFTRWTPFVILLLCVSHLSEPIPQHFLFICPFILQSLLCAFTGCKDILVKNVFFLMNFPVFAGDLTVAACQKDRWVAALSSVKKEKKSRIQMFRIILLHLLCKRWFWYKGLFKSHTEKKYSTHSLVRRGCFRWCTFPMELHILCMSDAYRICQTWHTVWPCFRTTAESVISLATSLKLKKSQMVDRLTQPCPKPCKLKPHRDEYCTKI